MARKTTGTEKKIGSSLKRDLPMIIPGAIKSQLDDAIPLPKHRVHRKSAESARLQLYWQLRRATFSRSGEISVNQKLLDKIIGQRYRKKIVEGLKSSGVFRLAKRHQNQIRCSTWVLSDNARKQYTDTKSTTVPTYVAPACGSGDLGHDGCMTDAGAWNVPEFEYLCRLETDCANLHESVLVMFNGKWRENFSARFDRAARSLWNADFSFKQHLRYSLSRCYFDPCTHKQCLDFAYDAIQRAATSHAPKVMMASELAACYLHSWNLFTEDPFYFCFRQGGTGRVYWGGVNQPKVLRRSFISFEFTGKVDRGVEVDLTSSYFVFLASVSKCASLSQAVAEDRVYETLGASCTQTFETRDQLKVAAQIQCLFGDKNFGRQPLFGAMHSIWPDAAKWVRHMRDRDGATGLANHLMQQEARFVWDRLVPLLRRKRIPTLPIHDGLIVPESAAETVREIATELIARECGVQGQFKIKR